MSATGSIHAQIEALSPQLLTHEREAAASLASGFAGLDFALARAAARTVTPQGLKLVAELTFQLGDMRALAARWQQAVAGAGSRGTNEENQS